jgi:hypothetical protein
LPKGLGSFSLLLTAARIRRLRRRRRRSGHLEVCFGGVRRTLAQKVVRRMRRKNKLHGKVFWPVVVLARKRESLEVTDQLATLITLL